MNTWMHRFVRAALLLVAACAGLLVQAQGMEDQLALALKDMNPKQRSKLAARETAEAQQDSAYQHAMSDAEAAFRTEQYEEALANYRKAREIRPYNVYPKVKIQDLQVLIQQRKAESQGVEPVPASPSDGDSLRSAAKAKPAVAEEPRVKAPAPQEIGSAPPPTRPMPPPESKPEQAIAPERPAPRLETPSMPDGRSTAISGERVYMEGGAVVTERTVSEGGRTTVYKRVVQRSGQVFHFKDGRAITALEWQERFR
jgi:hypothetical protein